MNHGISEQEWVQLIDGTLDPARHCSIQAHLDRCAECRDLGASLMAWESSWREAVSSFQAQCVVSDERAHELTKDAIAATHAEGLFGRAAQRPWDSTEAIDFLVRLLGPIYGAALVRKSVQTAALASSSSLAGGIGPAQWQSFVSNFTRTFANVCGRTAGGLARLAIEGLPMGEST